MAVTTDAFSAKFGFVTWNAGLVLDAKDIAIDRNIAEKPYASSSTMQMVNRRAGHQDKSGSFVAYVAASNAGPEDAMPFVEGDIFVLLLNSSAGQVLYNEKAIIISVAYSVPIEGGDLVEANVTWGRVVDP